MSGFGWFEYWPSYFSFYFSYHIDKEDMVPAHARVWQDILRGSPLLELLVVLQGPASPTAAEPP